MNSLPLGAFSSQSMKEKIPSGYGKFSLNNFTPDQMNLFKQLFGLVSPESNLSRLAMGDESRFSEIEQPALRQFGELQGGLASRFSGMGMGSRNSSGFQNTMNAAAQDFAKQLQSNRQELQRQAIMDLMGLSNSLLGQRPQETGLYEKKNQSSGIGGGIGALLGGLGGFALGGPTGALGGSQLGYGIGSSF